MTTYTYFIYISKKGEEGYLHIGHFAIDVFYENYSPHSVYM